MIPLHGSDTVKPYEQAQKQNEEPPLLSQEQIAQAREVFAERVEDMVTDPNTFAESASQEYLDLPKKIQSGEKINPVKVFFTML